MDIQILNLDDIEPNDETYGGMAMTDDDSPFFFIDDDYPIPAELPNSTREKVDVLEHLAETRTSDILFDNYVDLLESDVKSHVSTGRMPYATAKALLARYGIHLT